jgi:hypothetical protein
MQLDGWIYPKYVSSFIGDIHSVVGYLVSVIRFYLRFPEFYAPYILWVPCRVLVALAARGKKTGKTISMTDRPVSSATRRPKVHKSELKVASVVGAMDGRSVLLEISVGEGFHNHRTAIAWVDKPRAGKPLPTVTFVISPPDDDWGGATNLIQVPDEQLGDFEEVENRKGLYRLTSVLHVDDSECEDILKEGAAEVCEARKSE